MSGSANQWITAPTNRTARYTLPPDRTGNQSVRATDTKLLAKNPHPIHHHHISSSGIKQRRRGSPAQQNDSKFFSRFCGSGQRGDPAVPFTPAEQTLSLEIGVKKDWKHSTCDMSYGSGFQRYLSAFWLYNTKQDWMNWWVVAVCQTTYW